MTHKEQVQEWLNTEPSERSLDLGAKLMLQANRNRILHQHVIRKNDFAKIEYELKKYLGNDYPLCNEQTVQAMSKDLSDIENQLSENGKDSANPEKGKRNDHDSLPATIATAFEENLKIYPEMRSIHERLKVLNETSTPCDRYPFLKRLIELNDKLRTNWGIYDGFNAADVITVDANEDIKSETVSIITPKRISANRTFLSRAIPKISNVDSDKNRKILAEMQVRISEITAAGENFSDDQKTAFVKLGLNVN
jgi:hypothetical protein